MCACVKEAKLPEVQEINSIDEAVKKAEEMARMMNNDFCQRHNFSVVKNGDEVIIEVKISEH
jgi:hypothetical protein